MLDTSVEFLNFSHASIPALKAETIAVLVLTLHEMHRGLGLTSYHLFYV